MPKAKSKRSTAGAVTGRVTHRGPTHPNITEIDKRDPFHIPDFLRIPPEQRKAAWERDPPKATQFVPVRVSSPETQAAIDAAAAIKREKENARLRGLKGRKQREPTDTRGMVWDTNKSRFVPDRFAHMRCVPGKGMKDTQFTPTKDDTLINDHLNMMAKGSKDYEKVKSDQKRAQAADDLGANVSLHCGQDNAKLKAFATLNGVWQDKYDDLPNNGLRRMNVVNRLRGRLKREPKFTVKWK